MKQTLKTIFYSFPVQLVLLHLKKFQILLIFWLVLFGAVNGSFMQAFGVDSLYLAPEYLGEVSAMSAGIVGIAIGIFIMSWNITTFILFSRHFRFLATTTRPFLKYCINNAIIPLVFLFFYLVKAVRFDLHRELLGTAEIVVLVSGFLVGFLFIVFVSFAYFFGADLTIARRMISLDSVPMAYQKGVRPHIVLNSGGSRLIKVTSYLNGPFSVRTVRDVTHYSKEFLESIFSRHHFAAVLSIFIAFVFLMVIGYLLDYPIFQLPAAASITIFFAILVAVAGAFSYFLQSWSMPFLVVLVIFLNILYRTGVIDPSNKAYGLDYSATTPRANYSPEEVQSLCSPERMEQDKQAMLAVLEKWKARQKEEKPYLYMVCVSGGGTRSATFTLGVLQKLDSVCGGDLMRKVFMINGASGGMLGAAYYRELTLQKEQGFITDIRDPAYIEDISKDLLNPTFSSFVARDLAAPAQKFEVGKYSYVKDRAYSFEQKLNENTRFLMDKELSDVAKDEREARVPLMLFNSVITRDGRKMILSTLPVSYLMKPHAPGTENMHIEPDAVDFAALFREQDPMNLRLLTALRMNATFPYVLPNVWLPSTPVIDVMDAGLRDNFGLETSLRMMHVFRDWIKANTKGVVLLQIRDRKGGAWDFPFESKNISELVTKPLLLLQYNWYKMQEYNQGDLQALTETALEGNLTKLTFQYIPAREEAKAALNFHLTRREKLDIIAALDNADNKASIKAFQSFTNASKEKQMLTER
ncbi:patatin-like phospholipase family protein [Flavihumibacter rivuli]|uniref:patatin-like phospholipase family protein n=1 Tax=Flavihumibacter rivuli TaxID=2838156 RepID=UPI001BDEBA1D|nr:patatin-like phospholipase family protein [Flavihumibacter rivuli]ULQ55407.1 patatin-like phospholipase family protein [Flavihumibacter rivuli]